MKKYIFAILILLGGCTPEEPKNDGSGTLRLEIFRECMELASKLQSPQQSLSTTESEVDDVVYECSLQSNYMAGHITRNG